MVPRPIPNMGQWDSPAHERFFRGKSWENPSPNDLPQMGFKSSGNAEFVPRVLQHWGLTWQVHVFCSNGNPETPFAPENYGATVTRGPGVEIQPKHKITLPSPHFLVPCSILGTNLGFLGTWQILGKPSQQPRKTGVHSTSQIAVYPAQ